MTNIAYLRVSTNYQDIENQKFGVLDYCCRKKIGSVEYVEDASSGLIHWKERPIGSIINKAQNGDNIIVAEISRLGRSTLQVLEILEEAAKKKVSVHIAKGSMVMDSTMQSTITATILGLVSQIEREFISTRTKEALAKLKAEGKKLGRPKGVARFLKLDSKKDQITDFLKKGVSKRSIAKIIECSEVTLHTWIKRRGMKKFKPTDDTIKLPKAFYASRTSLKKRSFVIQ